MSSKKVLVAYFSNDGGTKKVAGIVARLAAADLARIEPVEAYPTDEAALERRTKAELDADARPEVTVEPAVDVAAYDAVLVGSPNWWGGLAAPVKTFLSGADLSGKTVAAFVSEAGDTTKAADDGLAALCPGAQTAPSLSVFSGTTTEAQVKAWLENIEVL